jgi:hypothetical protein
MQQWKKRWQIPAAWPRQKRNGNRQAKAADNKKPSTTTDNETAQGITQQNQSCDDCSSKIQQQLDSTTHYQLSNENTASSGADKVRQPHRQPRK